MSEQSKGNYSALMWVQEELQKSLALGLDAIQRYIDDPQDTRALSNCVEQLYQSHGTLEMLNLEGAQYLTAEMQAIATALRAPDTLDREAALDALVRSFLLLPNYLKLINEQFPDHPLCLLDTSNELRQLRGAEPFAAASLLPSIAQAPLPESIQADFQLGLPSISIEAHQLSHAFQHQLLKWFRQAEDSRLRKLRGILRYLRLSSTQNQPRLLWWIAEAYVEAIIHRGILVTAETKQLLGKLASPIKTFTQQDEAAFQQLYPEHLVQQLLLQIAKSTSQGPCVNSVKAHFSLNLLGKQTQLYGMSDNAMADAQLALLEELQTLKAVIDEFDIDAEEADAALDDMSQQLLTLSGTLDLLDLNTASDLLKQHAKALQDLVSHNKQGANDRLSRLADSLLQLESHLTNRGSEDQTVEAAALQHIVIQECLLELTTLKEELTLAAQYQGPSAELNSKIISGLNLLIGSLDILAQNQIAEVLKQTIEVLQSPPHAQSLTPTALEHLAEILSACELYMEALAHHGHASITLLDSAKKVLSHFGETIVRTTSAETETETETETEDSLIPETLFAETDVATEAASSDDAAAEETSALEFTDESDTPITIETTEEMESAETDNTLDFVNQTVELEDIADPTLHFSVGTADDVAVAVDDGLLFEISQTTEESTSRYAKGIDSELADVFVEEAEEVLTELHLLIPRWTAMPDEADLQDIRRYIHTLKGSGRMAGAEAIAALSMELENLLNEVLDGFNLSKNTLAEVLSPVVAVLADLVNRFIEGQSGTTPEASALQAQLQNVHSDTPVAGDEMPQELAELHIDPPAERQVTEVKAPEITDHALASEAEEALPVAEEGALTEDDELMAIFLSEAQQHVATLVAFSNALRVNQMVEKPLLSAAHSLKGCANIAGVKSVALIATELDKTCRELHRQQIALQPHQLDTLRHIIDGLDELLETIRLGHDEPDIRQLNDKIQSLRPVSAAEDAFLAIDPEQLVSFLEETDGLLDTYTRQLTEWQQIPSAAHQAVLHDTLSTLAENADYTELSALANLYRTLDQLIQSGQADQPHIEILLEQGYELLNLQIEALIQNKPATEIDSYSQQVTDALNSAEPTAQMTSVARYIAALPTATVTASPQTTVAKYIANQSETHTAQPTSVARYIAAQSDALPEKPISSVERYWQAKLAAPQSTQQPTSVDAYLARQAQSLTESVAEPAMDAESEPTTAFAEARDFAATFSAADSSVFDENLQEAVDPELLEAFSEEAGELLASSHQAIKQWQSTQDDDALMQLQRDLHTLKGGARLAGVNPIADLTHHVESLMLFVFEEAHATDDAFFDLLQRCQDQLTVMQEQLSAQQTIHPAGSLIAEISRFITGTDVVIPAPSEKLSTVIPPAVIPTHKAAVQVEAPPPVLNPTEQIRVRADLLDYLSNFAGEVSISRDRVTQQHQALRQQLGEMEDTVSRLHEQLRKLEIETETQILYRYEDNAADHIAEFDPLELDRFSTIQQLSRSLSESVIDMNEISQSMNELVRETDVILLQQSRLNTDLQQGLMDTRLLPFSHIVPRLERIVRQSSAETGKQAELLVEGAGQELDRAILDRLVAPIEHILRNAIAHGIEPPEQRQEKHKPTAGQLKMILTREGSEIVLTLQDDGQGLNVEKIREKALALGLITEDNMPADDALMQLILSSGFSTAESVSQLAGRGVGMDVVNSEIRALKGRLFIASTVDQGAKFTIRLPLTLSLIQALLVTAHRQQFAIPLASVKAGERIAAGTIRSLLGTHQPQYQFNGEKYDFVPLSHLLGQPLHLPEDNRQPLPLLLYRSGGMRVALLVDAINSNREIVIKSVGRQLAHINALNGATILGDGRVVLILDIATLIDNYKSQNQGITPAAPNEALLQQQVENRQPIAMIVDDSITMRKASGSLLNRLGFEVLTAKDGIEALAQLHEKQPDIILLDVEMPRMDGFEFASIVRNDSRFRHLPIIMITSRTGDKHRERALGIGVNDYLGKPYQENELVAAMKHLLKANYPPPRH